MLYQLLECEKREIQKQFNGMFAVIISRFDGLYKRNKPKGAVLNFPPNHIIRSVRTVRMGGFMHGHAVRTGCFEYISYPVTPQAMQFPANAHASERSLSLGWDFSGSAHEIALSAGLFHVKQSFRETGAGNTILRLGVAVILYWINASKSGIIIK